MQPNATAEFALVRSSLWWEMGLIFDVDTAILFSFQVVDGSLLFDVERRTRTPKSNPHFRMENGLLTRSSEESGQWTVDTIVRSKD